MRSKKGKEEEVKAMQKGEDVNAKKGRQKERKESRRNEQWKAKGSRSSMKEKGNEVFGRNIGE